MVFRQGTKQVVTVSVCRLLMTFMLSAGTCTPRGILQ